MTKTELRAYAACVGFTTIFCIHYIVAKEVLTEVTPLALGAARGLAGGLILCLLFQRLFRDLPKKLLIAAIPVGLFGFCLNQWLFLTGLQTSHAATAAVMSNLIPLATTALAIVIGIETYQHRRVAGLVIGFFGVSIYLLHEAYVNLVVVWSDVLILASVFSLATALVIAKRYLRDIPSPVLSGLMLLVGGIVLASLAGGELHTAWSYTIASTRGFWLMMFEVVISTALAYLLNLYAIKHLLVSRTMVFAYLQPVITAGLVFYLDGTLPRAELFYLFAAVVFSVGLTTWHAPSSGPQE